MQLLVTRKYPFIDVQSLENHLANDSLFRAADGSYLLYMSSTCGDERVIRLDSRSALLWVNDTPDLTL